MSTSTTGVAAILKLSGIICYTFIDRIFSIVLDLHLIFIK